MATREPPVELFYDPAELDPAAPRLHVRKEGGAWELRDADGELLGAHPTQDDAIDAALGLSQQRFSEILVRGSTGRAEWVVDQDPKWLKLAASWRKRSEARRRVNMGAFAGHHVLLPARRRHKDGRADGAAPSLPVELFYDPAELDPAAPRLHVRKVGGTWELRDGDGELLGGHAKLPDAIDAAEALSKVRFHEILVRGAVSPLEWAVSQNPDMVHLARELNRTVALEREAAD